MSIPDTATWQRTSPFAILFFLGRILRLIAKNAWQSLAPLFALLVAFEGDVSGKLTFAGVVFVVFITVTSLLSYWFFRFQIGKGAVLIRQGVFKKRQLDIKFERIQGINTTQNPVYRMLGLVNVGFNTAGSSGNEGNLPAVPQAFADSLRERLERSRADKATDEDDNAAEANPLVNLTWRDMIRIGLADRRVFIVLAFIGPFIERIDEDIDHYFSEFLRIAAANGIEFHAVNEVSVVLIIFFSVVLLFVVASITAAFLRYNNFRLFLKRQTLRSRAGLLTTQEQAMELDKIQTLRLEQGIVQRLMGRYRLSARQAVSSGRRRSQTVFTVPVVTAELAESLRRKLLAPEGGRLSQNPTNAGFVAVSPYYMRSRILFAGLVPALLAAAALLKPLGAIAMVFLLWLPIVAAAAYRSWKRAGYMHDDQEIVRRSGLLGYRTVSLLFRKVQRVTVVQTRYQRRKGLATLRIYMASGSVKVPYINHEKAKQLRDYILYKVESSLRAWH